MLETVGQRIRRLRKDRGWTQEQFAVRVNASAQKVSNWERDYTPPGAEDIAKIAEVCGTKSDFILTGHTETPSASNKNEKPLSELENLFFYELDKLSDEDKKNALEHVRYLRYRAEQENKK